MIRVIAKQSAYHPATGLHLAAGERYEIEEKHFSEEVFDRAGEPATEEEEMNHGS